MNPDELASGPPFDLVVVGGGINGCGIASAVARAGLRVALFEATDFGFGTTWRSTRLIHGGLRYLEHGDLRLVRQSLHERSWLLRTRPHLVRPQRFILPLVPWARRPAWQLRAGLATYDALSVPNALPRHRRLSAAAAARAIPALTPELNGAFAFYDARALSPERLALELALEARNAGAVVLNHTPVLGFEVRGGKLSGVRARIGADEVVVPCTAAVNAAGPWVDELLGLPSVPLLGNTRGTHIVVEPREVPGDAVFSTARSDGRVFFAVPQGQLLLIGTTDDRYEGEPGDVRPTPQDLYYLLDEARAVLPGLELDRAMVRYAYAGLRPLPRVTSGSEAAITRRHELVDHGRRDGVPGLYSVIGGKLSTFRPLAAEVLARVFSRKAPPGASAPVGLAMSAGALLEPLAQVAAEHLSIYGPEVAGVLALGGETICPHTGAVSGEVLHAVRDELAATVSDVLLRRTGIGWGACRGLCCHKEVAGLMAVELGWNKRERARQVAAFEADVAYHLPTPAEFAEEG